MAQLRISPRAISDLIEIWSYIADDSEAPGLGRRRDELAPGIQSFAVGRYIVFYRRVTGAIEIVRVLHGARDIDNIFEG